VTRTEPTIGVPQERRQAISEFLERESLHWTIVASPGGDLSIEEAEPGTECTARVLHPGGRIPCAVALVAAASLGVPGKPIGRLLNELRIKIHDCQLGCFS
jgi:hypothetical protein